MMSYSGVKISRTLKIVFSNFILFIPAGIILVALKIRETNPILLVAFSGVIVGIYYLYVLKTDEQIKKTMKEFGFGSKSLKNTILEKVLKSRK